MNRILAAIALAATALGASACKAQADIAPDPAASARRAGAQSALHGKLRLTDAPAEGEVDVLVRDAMKQASAEHRRVVVYAGARWCEPCQKFHHAAEKGELDAQFPDVTMLVFDIDHDGERLVTAGYQSKLIPLFALPGPDGKASGMQIEGGIKGEGAVGYIAPRLQKMLEM
ncbi:MAG TPA: thioredoxin [Polyangiaceae bacterium]